MKFLFLACNMLVSPKISKLLSNVLHLEIASSIVNSYVANVYKCWIEHMHVLDDNAHHLLFLGPRDKLDLKKHKLWFLEIHVGKGYLGTASKL